MGNTGGDGSGQVWRQGDKIVIAWLGDYTTPDDLQPERSNSQTETLQLETQFLFVGDPCYQFHYFQKQKEAKAPDWNVELPKFALTHKEYSEGILIKFDTVKRLNVTIFSSNTNMWPSLKFIEIEPVS